MVSEVFKKNLNITFVKARQQCVPVEWENPLLYFS